MSWTRSTGTACFFLLFAAIACGFAVAVVVSSNVVRMAFYLIVSLAAVAALFFLAGADFVGAMQLMIYVGGTLVLLVFGVMLTARGPFVSMPTGGGQWILAAIVGGSLLVVLAANGVERRRLATVRDRAAGRSAEQPATAAPLGLAMLGVRADQLDESDADASRRACPATCCRSRSFRYTCWSSSSARRTWPGRNDEAVVGGRVASCQSRIDRSASPNP